MNIPRAIIVFMLFVAISLKPVPAQPNPKLGDNSALRYWAAFAQMQDAALTSEQAKELNLILDGSAPYDDLKYKDLVEKNRPALETMATGTVLPRCDWGLDYKRGNDEPVDYARNALILGRLNVLYAFHLLIAGEKDRAAPVLQNGLRFSHDIGHGGTLFSTLIAKDLLTVHFRAIEFMMHHGDLSLAQRLRLQKTVRDLGPTGLDWQSAMKREMEILNRPPGQRSISLERVTQAYIGALNDPSTLPKLEQILVTVPKPLREVIPNPKKVLEQKQELIDKLRETRAHLQ
jgi:hypothetical protein